MDGERRIGGQMNNRNRPWHGALMVLDSAPLRFVAGLCSLGMVLLTVWHGAGRSGALTDPASGWSKLPGRVASTFGLAADDIQITGLSSFPASELLSAVGVQPGGSLIGFDTGSARKTLEALPWLQQASVTREYPNILRIEVKERTPIAIWQHGNEVDLVDGTGVAMGHYSQALAVSLPVITGEGANEAAPELVNLMSANPGLSDKVSAAARVGKRRWTLYLNTGVRLALPEEGAGAALQQAMDLDKSTGMFSKGVGVIDLRWKDRLVLQIADASP